MENENLPAIFSEEHVSIADRLISRVTDLLARREKSIENYGAQLDYANRLCETLKLKINGYAVSIQVTKD